MLKYFLLISIGWLSKLVKGRPAAGLVLLGLYYLYMIRYRSYHGRLSAPRLLMNCDRVMGLTML